MFVFFSFFCRTCLNTCRATWRTTVKYILDSSEVMHSMKVEFILIKSALLFCYFQCIPFHFHKASLKDRFILNVLWLFELSDDTIVNIQALTSSFEL